MRNRLASPRFRRRFGWTLGIGLAVVGVVAVGVMYSYEPEPETAVSTEADTTTTATLPPLRVTPVVRREVDETVQQFVRTAVIRRNLESAWPLASPVMRQSVTHREWERGDIPVQPFPATALAGADWRLRYRYERTLGIDVMVQPKERSGAPVAVYSAELTAAGSGPPRRFLVDYWIPQATLGQASTPPAGQPPPAGASEAQPELAYDEGRLGAEWFLVPAGIVLLLIALLGGFAIRSVLRARRAERLYRERAR
jgi:hypothetical protein